MLKSLSVFKRLNRLSLGRHQFMNGIYMRENSLELIGRRNPLTLLIILPLLAALVISMMPDIAHGKDDTPALTSVDSEYFTNNRNGTMWTAKRSKRLASIDDVQDYLSNLNQGQFKDWRLPTKQELYELIAIFDLKDNGQVKVQVEGKYWYFNDNGSMVVGSWEVGDGCGPSRKFYSGEKGYVWAVRP
jgi:hypothetical protein